MVVHSMSPHFFHSGGGFSNTVDVVASVGAGAVEEVFPQDKRMGNKQQIESIFLVKKRRYRTWRGYDICQATRLFELQFWYVKRS
jgi:hypothetical protein